MLFTNDYGKIQGKFIQIKNKKNKTILFVVICFFSCKELEVPVLLLCKENQSTCSVIFINKRWLDFLFAADALTGVLNPIYYNYFFYQIVTVAFRRFCLLLMYAFFFLSLSFQYWNIRELKESAYV